MQDHSTKRERERWGDEPNIGFIYTHIFILEGKKHKIKNISLLIR